MTDSDAGQLPAADQTDRLHLSPRHREKLEALLCEHLPGIEVWAYGSRVNGESHDGSDLDLVLRAPGLQEVPIGPLADFTEALHDSTLPFLVEARDWARLPERFHKEIERGYVVLVEKKKQGEMNEWERTTLGEIVTLQRGFDLPATKRKPGPYPVIASTGPVGTHNKAAVQGPGVVIGRSGSLGGGQFIKNDFWPLNTTLWVKDFKNNDPKFCYFLLKSLDLVQFNVGSGVPTLNRNHIHPLPVRKPPLYDQRAIAHILGTLDDKIKLNRRMNETLEAMVQVLFKSWFVEFEPVRAKMEGRWHPGESLPGLPAHLYDLFPDRLVESELGEVPEGWGAGTLGNIANAPRRGVHPADMPTETPYIGLEHMPRRSIALVEWGNAGKITSSKSIFEKGDILFGKLRPYFHKVGIAPVQGICSTDIVVIVPKSAEWLAFTLTCVSSIEFVNYTNQTATGTKMPRTSWKTMSRYPVCLPPTPVVQAFENAAKPILEFIVASIHESRKLAAIRDVLLPKLILGELR